jgi:hypothetical protein
MVTRKVGEACSAVERLTVLQDPQAELLLLRACAGVCRLVHLLRCTPPSAVAQGVDLFDATLHAALRRITVGEWGGFGPLQDEIADLPLCMGGLGVPRGQDIRLVTFLASALQSWGLQEEVLGEWEVPPNPEVNEARKSFQEVVGDFNDTMLDSSEFIRTGLQGQLGLLLANTRRKYLLAPPAP